MDFMMSSTTLWPSSGFDTANLQEAKVLREALT